MGVLEIVLLLAGGVLAVLSFVLPVEKEAVQEDTKKLAQEEIKTLVERQMNDIRQHVDDVVGEAVTYAVEKTERSLERLSNEKIMAVNEYSDTVLGEIHKNHEETVFLYDMLNSKHNNLKNTVNELNKTIQEAKEVKREAEAVVSSLEQMEAQKSRNSESVNGALFQSLADVGRLPIGMETIAQPVRSIPVETIMQPVQGIPVETIVQPVQSIPVETIVQPASSVPMETIAQPVPSAPVETIAQAVRSIPLETIVQSAQSVSVEPVVHPVPSAPLETIVQPVPSISMETIVQSVRSVPLETIVQPVPGVSMAQGAPSIQNVASIPKGVPPKGTGTSKQPEQMAKGPKSPAMAGTVMDLQFMTGEEAGSNNNKEQILKLYQQGKSKVAIAKELGLGVGEVKLVIDLYKSL